MPITEREHLVTTQEAAERLKVSRRTVARMVDSGELTAHHKLPGRTGAFLFTASEIERAVLRRAEPAAT